MQEGNSVQLKTSRLSIEVLPDMGGGLSRCDGRLGNAWVPLMRAYPSSVSDSLRQKPDPNRVMACYPLVPWSNRISDGGFSVGNRRVALPLNRSDEPFPIHGSGWQRPWRVQRHERNEILLDLEERTADAYSYHAEQRYSVRGDTLRVALSVTNIGRDTMPFGLGLHPFFSRDADTRLWAPAKAVWLNDGRTPLPVELAPIPGAWRFVTTQALPTTCVDHCFTGWTGQASVHWPSRGLRLDIEADADHFVMYTPVDEDFFCFEPVDHAINAVNLPGGATTHGMTSLGPGERLERRFSFALRDD